MNNESLYGKRIKALESSIYRAQRLSEEIDQIDILSHLAEVYYPIHEDISSGQHQFVNLIGGRGSAKSSTISLELIYQIMKDKTGLSNGLVIRKWAVSLRGSVFSQLQWAIDVLGVSEHWRSSLNPMQFVYTPTGQVIKLSGLDDPQKLRSIKPQRGYFKFLWCEEFCELGGELEVRNLQQSVLRGGNNFCVLRSFNPPISRANWANAYIEIPDERAVTLLTNYTQIPEEWLGRMFIDEAERLREINPRAYDNEYLGLAIGSGSEVFETLEVREIPEEEYQQQDKVFCGIDWGFSTDPACFLRVSYDARTETVRILDEIYKTHLSNKDLAELIIDRGFHRTNVPPHYNEFLGMVTDEPQLIFCDSAEPKSINDMRTYGLKTLPCTKFQGCVEYRLKWLQRRKIIVDPQRCPNCARELTNYNYNIDKRTGEILSSVPDKDNHSIDALAYSLDRVIYNRKYSA